MTPEEFWTTDRCVLVQGAFHRYSGEVSVDDRKWLWAAVVDVLKAEVSTPAPPTTLTTQMAALLFRSSTICMSTGSERDALLAKWKEISPEHKGETKQ